MSAQPSVFQQWRCPGPCMWCEKMEADRKAKAEKLCSECGQPSDVLHTITGTLRRCLACESERT